MPYNYAHALVGYSTLKNHETEALVGRPFPVDAFFLGTMGPDPFYGDSYPPPLFQRARADLADCLHGLDGETLFSRLFALSDGSAVRTAYTFGFLCHFLLDNHVHPYIEARFPGKAHTPAEIGMDIPLVLRANEPRLLVSPKAFYRTDAAMEIDALLAALFSGIFALDTKGLYARALKKWLRLNAFLYDPAEKKRAALRHFPSLMQYCIAPRPNQSELMNLIHAPWSDADARTASVPELIENAEAEIRLRINQIASGRRESALAALRGRNANAAGIVS